MAHRFCYFFLIFFIGCYTLSRAQSFYVSSPINPLNITLGSYIDKVTLTPGGLVIDRLETCYPKMQFRSIAMNEQGLYWLEGNNIYGGVIVGNQLTSCQQIMRIPFSSSAFSMGPDGKGYIPLDELYAADLAAKSGNSLGILRYRPSGDACFYDGQLYMASEEGIVKINIQDPSSATVHISLPSSLQIFGLVSVATGLRQNTMYALSLVDEYHTDIIEIDIANKRLKNVRGVLPFAVLDAASSVEGGRIIGIVIDRLKIGQNCITNAGTLEVITKPHLEDFTYTLNGVTNQTGKFESLQAGKYILDIVSASDHLTTEVTIPAFNMDKPIYSRILTDQQCDQLGEIKFVTPDQNSTYKIKYQNDLFPLNHTFTGLSAATTHHFEILNENGCMVDFQDLKIGRSKCKIEIDQVTIAQQCDAFHKGTVHVSTKPHVVPYNYELNGVINTTGIFDNVNAGTYLLTITSDEDKTQRTIVVPDYKLSQPKITYIALNPKCADKGSIKFSIADNTKTYKIKYQDRLYAVDHQFSNLETGNHQFTIVTQNDCLVDQYTVALVYEPCAIVIDDVSVSQECDVLGKGFITISCPVIPETYTFRLNGNISNNDGIFHLLDPGTYEIEVSASGGGTAVSRNVIVPDYNLLKPFSRAVVSNPICELPGSLYFVLSDPSAYLIRYQSVDYPSNHVFRDLFAGRFEFTILDQNGCLKDVLHVDLVTEACSSVAFPSAFSPNGDGINDVFIANQHSKAANFRLQVFNRYGAVIFTSSNLSNGWNGEHKGEPVPSGTYFYVATYFTEEKKQETRKGSITLIR